VDYEPPSLRARIAFFFLISIPVLIVWGTIDACRYFFFSDRPTAKETAWMVGGYIGMWIIGDFIEQSRWNQKLLRDLDSRVAAIEKRNKK
jgi:hypothetical protein